MPYQPGQIAKLTQAIYEKGGNITALSTFEGDSNSNFMMTVKVEGIEKEDLQKLVEPLVISLLDIGVS
jgi:formyltetrahydrofolate hydrolase